VLHIAICNLRGLWAAVICKEKESEEEINVQKLLPGPIKDERNCSVC
jgi:hypothetical protein